VAPAHPLIAVNGLLEPGERPALRLANRYCEAVISAGGIPVAIPPVGTAGDLRRLLESVDGLLLTGGDDFDMERLGRGTTHPSAVRTPPEKQGFDVALAQVALEARIPVLGICYGMQLLALVEGGDLYQHVPEDRPGAQEHSGGAIHSVSIEPGSRLGSVLGVQHLDVVSRHHQAVAVPPSSWRVAARDGQGLIEAVERPDYPFALGVQWHPELAARGSADERLIRALVDASRERRAGPRGIGPVEPRAASSP
jgi:putative glutamine amidotransferase